MTILIYSLVIYAVLLVASTVYMKRIRVLDPESPEWVIERLTNRFRKVAFGIYISTWGFIYLIFLGIFENIILWLLPHLFDLMIWISAHWWFSPFALALAWALFVLRCKLRSVYGVLEVATGSLGVITSVISAYTSGLTHILTVMASIYVVIRGLDNIDNGIIKLIRLFPRTWMIPVWVRWQYFKFHSPDDQEIREFLALISEPSDSLPAQTEEGSGDALVELSQDV